MAQLYKHHPQLRDAMDYVELSTPLSTEWFQWNMEGEIYGIDHSVERFKQHWLHSQTPIKNLYLTGADIVTAGVGGALMGGVLTASRILGFKAGLIGKLIAGAYKPGREKQTQVEPVMEQKTEQRKAS